MPEYLMIEAALKKIVSKTAKEKYNQTAGSFESILTDQSTRPREKASKIAKIILNGNQVKL